MKTTFKAVATKLPEGLQVDCESRGFKILIDEPTELGGTDKGMNPVEALLAALGACQTICAFAFAESQNIKLEAFHTELEGDLDPDGFMGIAEGVRNGFQEIRYSMHMKADNTQEELEKFAEFIESRCPVADCLTNGVPMKLAAVVKD